MICASPDYLTRFGSPRHPDELRDHECIYARGAYGLLDWKFTKGTEQVVIRPASQLVLNDTSATLIAAVSGAGLARVSAYLAKRDLEAGDLQTVLGDWKQDAMPVSILFAAGRRSEAKIKTFVDFLVAKFSL